MTTQNSLLRNRRGGTLALIAVSLSGLLAAVSLAIDLGELMTARGEAQRIADSAALAAASAYLGTATIGDSAATHDTAVARARAFAQVNEIRGVPVDVDADLQIQFLYSEEKVRVHVRRVGMGTWFARFAGIFSVDISAAAAAETAESHGVACVKPWAFPDLWWDTMPPSFNVGGPPHLDHWDANDDRMWNDGEGIWVLESPEHYRPFVPGEADDPANPMTGLGSNFRYDHNGNALDFPPNDRGLKLVIKPGNPNDNGSISSPFFAAWQLQPGESGKPPYDENIRECNEEAIIDTESTYDIEPGNMAQPTSAAANYIKNQDPAAEWDEVERKVINCQACASGNWKATPRVFAAAIFDPNQIVDLIGTGSGTTKTLQFNQFGLFFLEGKNGTPNGDYHANDDIHVRYIEPASGTAEGGAVTTTPVIKHLRLVE